ncbi:13706_t:CDS:1, partial [Funneliformis caledonium]
GQPQSAYSYTGIEGCCKLFLVLCIYVCDMKNEKKGYLVHYLIYYFQQKIERLDPKLLKEVVVDGGFLFLSYQDVVDELLLSGCEDCIGISAAL